MLLGPRLEEMAGRRSEDELLAEREVANRQVVAERPADEKARQRLAEIGSSLAVGRAGAAGEVQDSRRRALQRTIAGLEVLLGVARRR